MRILIKIAYLSAIVILLYAGALASGNQGIYAINISVENGIWCRAYQTTPLENSPSWHEGMIEFVKMDGEKCVTIMSYPNDDIIDVEYHDWEKGYKYIVAKCQGGAVGYRYAIFEYSEKENKVRLILNKFSRSMMIEYSYDNIPPDITFIETDGGRKYPYYLLVYKYNELYRLSEMYKVTKNNSRRKIKYEDLPYDVKPGDKTLGWNEQP